MLANSAFHSAPTPSAFRALRDDPSHPATPSNDANPNSVPPSLNHSVPNLFRALHDAPVTHACCNNVPQVPTIAENPRPSTLRIITLNPWSICNKTTLIHDFIIDHQPDLLCITETWMTGTESDKAVMSALLPPGYAMLHAPRLTRGGGTAIVHRSCISVRPSSEQIASLSFELQDCIVMAAHPVRICNLYRSPTNGGQPTTEFFREFTTYLETLATHPGHVILVGDFNFHINVPNDRDAREFRNLLSSLALKQHVQGPTHRSGNTLDLVITRNTDTLVTTALAIDHGFRDHFPVFIDTSLKKPPNQKKTVSCRKTKSVTAEALNHAISRTSLSQPIDHLPLDELVHLYNNELSAALDCLAPLKTRTIVHRPDSEWYSDDIRAAKQVRRRMERKWRKSGLQVHRELFIEQRDRINTMIEAAKQNYYRGLINKCQNSKQLFGVANKLLGRKAEPVLPSSLPVELIAERFNDFFIEKVTKLRDSIVLSEDPTPRVLQAASTMADFTSVNETDVSVLLAAAPVKTCDLDPMPTDLVKLGAEMIIPIITRIINLSLSSGVFPKSCKESLIRPLLKKAKLDPEDMGNYRPIANLSLISKLIEKVVAFQLNDYLSNNNLIEPNQSAYRQGHSTETALIHVYDKVIREMGSGKVVLFVMIDLSAAFDTVDLAILLQTLNRLGIIGTAAAWFTSYLQHRKQSVKTASAKSGSTETKHGVPQGSVLGPILFTLYTASLGHLIRHHGIEFHCYADDTQLWIPCEPQRLQESFRRMEACLDDIQKWMGHFRLKMNCAKTECLLIAKKNMARDNNIYQLLSIGDERIRPTDSAVKNLGVTMTSDMSFDAHVTNVVRASFAQLKSLSRIKRFLDKKSLEKLVHAFITSRVDYCNALLLGAPARVLRRLQSVQNAAARLITCTQKFQHISPILKDLHWLPVKKRIQFKVLLTVFKSVHRIGPSYLQSMCQRRSQQSL